MVYKAIITIQQIWQVKKLLTNELNPRNHLSNIYIYISKTKKVKKLPSESLSTNFHGFEGGKLRFNRKEDIVQQEIQIEDLKTTTQRKRRKREGGGYGGGYGSGSRYSIGGRGGALEGSRRN